MDPEEVKKRLLAPLDELSKRDSVLFTNDLSERCIAFRLAMYLQHLFPDHSVDAEYNRKGRDPKTLNLPPQCANYLNNDGSPLVVPDIIVHRRGVEGPNILVVEVKKTTNRNPRDCDHARIHAFREQLAYGSAALVECETRNGREPTAMIVEWLPQDEQPAPRA
jgi:hypothetical protein